MTPVIENIFLSHAHTAAIIPRCASLAISTMSGSLPAVSLLRLVDGLVDEALDGWEMRVACPQERNQHPLVSAIQVSVSKTINEDCL